METSDRFGKTVYFFGHKSLSFCLLDLSARAIGLAEADLFAPEFTTSEQKLMKLYPKMCKLLASTAQSELMHEKTIARSHSVLMHGW